MIVEIDAAAASDALLADIYVVDDEAKADALGGAPRPSFAERVARYRNPGPGTRRRWLARLEGEPAGLAMLQIHGEGFSIGEVNVRPLFRRRGLGRALFDTLCAGAREQDVATFFGHYSDDAGAAFARAMGAVDDQREVKSVLRLREADLPEPAGADLRSWVGPVPEEMIESYVRARCAMADAPTPDGVADVPWTLERQRADDAALVGRGTPPHTTVAVDGGDVVALTAIRVGAAPCPYVTTDDTAVVPHMRGRGLAYAVKLENLRRLRDERPDVELVGTMNAEHNAAMRTVNTKLGFVPTLTLTTAVVKL